MHLRPRDWFKATIKHAHIFFNRMLNRRLLLESRRIFKLILQEWNMRFFSGPCIHLLLIIFRQRFIFFDSFCRALAAANFMRCRGGKAEWAKEEKTSKTIDCLTRGWDDKRRVSIVSGWAFRARLAGNNSNLFLRVKCLSQQRIN